MLATVMSVNEANASVHRWTQGKRAFFVESLSTRTRGCTVGHAVAHEVWRVQREREGELGLRGAALLSDRPGRK